MYSTKSNHRVSISGSQLQKSKIKSMKTESLSLKARIRKFSFVFLNGDVMMTSESKQKKRITGWCCGRFKGTP